MTDIETLRKLAGAANDDHGWYPASVIWDLLSGLGSCTSEADAAYIAAADPATVLGLIRARDEAREAVKRLAGALDDVARWVGGMCACRADDEYHDGLLKALADPVVKHIVEGG